MKELREGRPRISIVTVCLNQARYIGAALESVLSQDYRDVEYIVVDGGSTDGSRSVIQRYSSKLSSVIFEPDDGPADALNKGLRRITGEIFGYLNADDILLPGALQYVIDQFARRPHVDVLVGDAFEIDSHGRIVRRLFSAPWSVNALRYGQCPIIQPATFIRSNLLAAVHFNPQNRTCWDGELLADLALAGAKVANIRRTIAGFRMHPESISGSGRLQEKYRIDCARVTQKLGGRRLGAAGKALETAYKIRRLLMRPSLLVDRLVQPRPRSTA